jgi:ABC-type multidrug transport system permease subunit
MESNSLPANPKELVKAIRIFWIALITGPILFAGITTLINKLQQPAVNDKRVENIFLIVAGSMALVCLLFSRMQYRKKISTANQFGLTLMQKLSIYRDALIKYLAICEGAALFGIICFFLTANYFFLAISGIMIAAMLLKRPEKQRIFNELQLDSKEQMELN